MVVKLGLLVQPHLHKRLQLRGLCKLPVLQRKRVFRRRKVGQVLERFKVRVLRCREPLLQMLMLVQVRRKQLLWPKRPPAPPIHKWGRVRWRIRLPWRLPLLQQMLGQMI